MQTRALMAACCLVLVAGAASAQQKAGGLTVIRVEKAAEPDEKGKVSFDVTLRNDSAANIPLQLFIAPFRSEHGTPVRVKAAFEPKEIPAELEPAKPLQVRIVAEARWPAGISTAELRNGNSAIASLQVDQDPVFGVKPDGWSENAPLALRIEEGAATYLRLVNPDGVPWRVKWSLVIDGKEVSREALVGSTEQMTLIPVPHDEKWFPTSTKFGSLFRDEDVPATLRLAALRGDAKPDVLWPVRVIDVKLQRSYWSSVGRVWVGSFVLVVVLLAGGVCSLLVTNFLPNWKRKSALLARVASAHARLRALPDEVSSLARVRARVDAQQLVDAIQPRWTLSSDFTGFVTQWQAAVERLERRVALLEEIGSLIDSIASETDHFAVSYLSRAYDRLADAQRHLSNIQITEAMLATARSAVDGAAAILASLEQPTDEMRNKAAADVQAAVPRLTAPVRQVLQKVPHVERWIDERYTAVENINADNFWRIDAAVAKLELVVDFVNADGGSDARRLQAFVGRVNTDEYAAYRAARLIVFQLQQGVTVNDLEAAVQANAFSIVSPACADAWQPATFRIEFQDEALNTHAARFGVTCEWNFGDGYREIGWEVAHYFRAARDYTVTARLLKGSTELGKASTVMAVNKPADEQKQVLGNQTWLDVTHLAVMLGLAIIALLAGAKDQIANVDLLPGLIAVFTLGFSADQVKNVLAPKE